MCTASGVYVLDEKGRRGEVTWVSQKVPRENNERCLVLMTETRPDVALG